MKYDVVLVPRPMRKSRALQLLDRVSLFGMAIAEVAAFALNLRTIF